MHDERSRRPGAPYAIVLSTVSASRAFKVRLAVWERDQAVLKRIRLRVFVIEQGVPEALEWDGIDPDCRHAIAEDDKLQAIGCGRLLPDGHIGRMAVLRQWRGLGVGAALLQSLVALARELGHERVLLNAQVHALPFYRRHGFTAVGPPFMDAGIAHQSMERSILR